MGFGSFISSESESKAEDNRIDVSDEGQVAARRSKILNPYSTNLEAKSRLNTGLDLSGIKVQKGGTFSLELGASTEDMLAITDSLGETLSGFSATTSNTVTTALEQTSTTVKDALDKISKLSESAQTGGDSGRNQIILYVVFGVLALLGMVVYWRK